MKLVLDSFYPNPEVFRELALGMRFTARHRNFPGLRSTRAVIPGEIRKLFSTMLGLGESALDNAIPYNGCFQLMRASDWSRAYVHADHPAHWAALVYLSEKLAPASGTSFYRHKATGLVRYPASASSQDEKLRALLKREGSNPAKWEEIDRIGFSYNRLLVYDARLFHRNGRPWGRGLEDGRLTHNFFA